MSTIVSLPDQSTAKLPAKSYLNQEYGLKSWLLTGDHKRIAMLYLFSITFFFIIGGVLAGLIRLELLTPPSDLMATDTYNKVFSMHGIIMVFLFLVPSVPATIGNFLIPLMVGARDLAFPKINLLSWYLYMGGGLFILAAMVLGGVDTGWTFTTPLSTHYVNTHVVTAAMGIFLAGFSSIFTGLNFIVTIHRMRCPGMTWFRLPLFVWGHYATSIIMILGTPVLAITLVLVALERLLNIGVFDPDQGRRSAAVSAFVLVLFPSSGVHHDLAWDGRHLRSDQYVLSQASLRLYRGCILLRRHRRLRLSGVGTSHVHHGRQPVFCAGFLADDHAGCGALGHQDFQLVDDAVQRFHHL